MISIRISNPSTIESYSFYFRIHYKDIIVSEGYTLNNEYKFKGNKNNIYRLEIYSKYIFPYYRQIYFIPVNNVIINFNNIIVTNKFLTFYLYDKFYNLPIEKGQLNFYG